MTALLAVSEAGLDNATGLVLAVLVAGFLVYSLVRPERF